MRCAGGSGPYSSQASSCTPYWMLGEADALPGASKDNDSSQTIAAIRILMSPPFRRTRYAFRFRGYAETCLGRVKIRFESVGQPGTYRSRRTDVVSLGSTLVSRSSSIVTDENVDCSARRSR